MAEHVGERARSLVEHQVDVAGDLVLDRGAAAAIRHELETGVGRALEIDATHMRRAAGADGCGRRLVGVGLEPGDQRLEIVGGKILTRGDEHRAVGQQRYGGKILEHVVLHRVDRARADVAQPITDADRVAVRRRACGAPKPDAAAGAGDVLDHDGLAECDGEMIGKDARNRIGDPAGRHRHDDGDGARWIELRPRRAPEGRQRGSARGQTQDDAASKFHRGPSLNGGDACA